jgi:hypothetical protein
LASQCVDISRKRFDIVPIDPTNSLQAKAACEACFGVRR